MSPTVRSKRRSAKARPRSSEFPIARALRLLREEQGLTQTELGQRGGPDFRTISHWETGRKMPSFPLLIRYLSVLDRNLHDLQDVADQLAGLPGNLSRRVSEVERRLDAVERAQRGGR